MKKRWYIVLGVGLLFLVLSLILFFAPRDVATYSYTVDSQGVKHYSKTPTTYFGLSKYDRTEYNVIKYSDLQFKGRTQYLPQPIHMSHEEKFDILTSDCRAIFYNELDECVALYTTAGSCRYYYQQNKYDYCKSVYDETSFGMDECKKLYDIYIEYFDQYDIKPRYRFFDLFTEYYCKLQSQ